MDIGRVFPLNKMANGSAIPAEVPSNFKDGILKFNPRLFNLYEKINSKINKKDQLKNTSNIYSSK